MPTEGVKPYDRRDIHHVSADQRPTKVEYDRYLWLLQLLMVARSFWEIPSK